MPTEKSDLDKSFDRINASFDRIDKSLDRLPTNGDMLGMIFPAAAVTIFGVVLILIFAI